MFKNGINYIILTGILCFAGCSECVRYHKYKAERIPNPNGQYQGFYDDPKDKTKLIYGKFDEKITILQQTPEVKVKMYPWSKYEKRGTGTRTKKDYPVYVEEWSNCSCEQPDFNPCDYWSFNDSDCIYYEREHYQPGKQLIGNPCIVLGGHTQECLDFEDKLARSGRLPSINIGIAK